MAEDIATLGIKVLSGDIVKATRRLDKLEKQSKKSVKSNKKLGDSFKGVGTAIGGLGLGLAFKSIISLAIEQERVVRQLDAAIESTGGSAGFTTKELQKMAAGFQEVTNYGDEAIISAQSILLTFTNLKGDVLPATTEAVLDLSERMGTDLKSSAIQLGKALNDPVANLSALSRSGIQFSESQKDTINALVKTNRLADAQKIILKELKVQFGGSAKAARDTFGGAIKSLGNAFGDLLEGDGGNLKEAKGATEDLIKLLQDDGTKAAFAGIVTGVIAVTTALIDGVVWLNKFGESIGTFLAGGDGTKTLKEIDNEIRKINDSIRSTEGFIKQNEEGGFLTYFTGGSDKKVDKLRELRVELDLLKMQRDAMTKKSDGEEGADPKKILDPVNDPVVVPKAFDQDAELEALQEKHTSELDLLREKAHAENEILKAKLASDSEFEDEAARLKYKIKVKLSKDELALDKKTKKSKMNLEMASGKMAASIADKFAVLMTSKNKEMFEIGKAAATASALINTYQGATKALAQGGFWGIFMAAAVVAAGIAQVSSIQSQQFGGGGGGGGGSMAMPSATLGGGTFPDSSGLSDVPDTDAAPRQQVSITLNGAGYSKENVRELITSINEEVGDGAELVATQ